MKPFDLARAWEKVKHETLVNKPTFTPYSEKVVKTGELLLSAHTLLALYETQSSSENLREIAEEFEATMEQYKQEVYQTKN